MSKGRLDTLLAKTTDVGSKEVESMLCTAGSVIHRMYGKVISSRTGLTRVRL